MARTLLKTCRYERKRKVSHGAPAAPSSEWPSDLPQKSLQTTNHAFGSVHPLFKLRNIPSRPSLNNQSPDTRRRTSNSIALEVNNARPQP